MTASQRKVWPAAADPAASASPAPKAATAATARAVRFGVMAPLAVASAPGLHGRGRQAHGLAPCAARAGSQPITASITKKPAT